MLVLKGLVVWWAMPYRGIKVTMPQNIGSGNTEVCGGDAASREPLGRECAEGEHLFEKYLRAHQQYVHDIQMMLIVRNAGRNTREAHKQVEFSRAQRLLAKHNWERHEKLCITM